MLQECWTTLQPSKRDSRLRVDYLEALQHGQVVVAYARVMLIGPGGVGKSSLLHGLRNKKLPQAANSTQLADTYNLRPTDSFWAKSIGGGHWSAITDEDEIRELAQLIKKVCSRKSSADLSPDASSSGSFKHPEVKAIIDEIMKECLKTSTSSNSSAQDSEVYLRVWDCGGQPVFLNLLSAFLTARTLFLLMFDARQNLHSQSLHLSHFQGRASEQVDGMTTLELMVQWMATIHATLLKKQSFVNHYEGPANNDNLSRFPQILPVGTHSDDEAVKGKSKDDIFNPLKEACANKAFSHLLRKSFLVDNTTAGKGDDEDPAFREICKIAEDFASTDLAIPTPITWVLFRKVFQRYSRGKPVVPLEEVEELAAACLIPEDSLSSVLAFYHDLSVFFHYTSVPSLAGKVIANPQWLIKQIAKISPLEGFEGVDNGDLWILLRRDGILVEKLYNRVLRSQECGLTPQAIVDLLEHFQIISRINSRNRHPHKGLEYFMPSMLPPCKNLPLATDCIRSVNPIHLIFSTNYLPPGFFVRLVTAFSKHKNFHVDFSNKLYSNVMKLHYGLDNVTLTERKSSISIQIHRVHSRENGCRFFITTCHEILRHVLPESVKEVQNWFPGIEVSLAAQCKGSRCPEEDHFVPLPPLPCESSTQFIPCQKSFSVKLTPAQFWYYTKEFLGADEQAASTVCDLELDIVAKEVREAGKLSELTEALEMAELTGGTGGDPRVILTRWQKEMMGQGIPTRPHLLMQLRMIGMEDLHAKLLFNDFGVESVESQQSVHLKPSSSNTTSSSAACLTSPDSVQDSVESKGSPPFNKKPAIKNLISDDDFMRASEVLRKYAHKWRDIGQGLGFKARELDSIESQPRFLSSAPSSYLMEMLSSWQQWTPGDHRGSTSYATRYSLREAVNKAGLALTAEEL